INNEIKKHNYIHSRAPSQPALLAMFLSLLYFKKKFWFKYAGSWVDKTSFYYRFQRFVLKYLRSNAKVTINGTWPNQKPQVLTFENPCLNAEDRVTGLKICKSKKTGKPFEFCFVGNLDSNKGVDLLFEALRGYQSNDIECIHIVGNGILYPKLLETAKELNVNVVFHGFLSKEALIPIYKRSSFIILPSKSEGFPKVIGEAMNYGCIPIVTDISCISQYIINETNGYLIASAQISAIHDAIKRSLSISPEKQGDMIENNYARANCFTYSYYVQRITKTVFN
ncbi:MAG: glycosyltransferase, partial [Flavobacteriaceae bacterium]